MRRIEVKVKANAKKTEILKEIENRAHIAVKAKAKEGEANKELIRFLAKHYKCRPIIKSGLRSKTKIIELS